MKTLLALLAALALTGCESVRFGVAVMQADTEISLSHGDGKTVLGAQQGENKISGFLRR
jgi:hypothetical protein